MDRTRRGGAVIMNQENKTREMMLELDELRRGWQMLQLERDGVYMGFATTNTAFVKQQRTISNEQLQQIRKRIEYLESVI